MNRTLLRPLAVAAVAVGALSAFRAAPDAENVLSTTLTCEPSGPCEAFASGGNGTYDWSWSMATEQTPDGDSFSLAYPNCYFGSNNTIKVTVTVTSGGQTASRSRFYSCGYA